MRKLHELSHQAWNNMGRAHWMRPAYGFLRDDVLAFDDLVPVTVGQLQTFDRVLDARQREWCRQALRGPACKQDRAVLAAVDWRLSEVPLTTLRKLIAHQRKRIRRYKTHPDHRTFRTGRGCAASGFIG
jgi:hypothetical protein